MRCRTKSVSSRSKLDACSTTFLDQPTCITKATVLSHLTLSRVGRHAEASAAVAVNCLASVYELASHACFAGDCRPHSGVNVI